MDSFTFLWHEEDDRKSFESFDFIEDLRLASLIDMNKEAKPGEIKLSLSDFFTLNPKTIKMRCGLFDDLCANKDFYLKFKDGVSLITDAADLGRSRQTASYDTETSLYSIKEIELYVKIIRTFHDLFEQHTIFSPVLKDFKGEIDNIYNDKAYKDLAEQETRQCSKINNIKSITVGINLDPQLLPTEAGILSINDEYFVSGNIIDKLLKCDFGSSDYSCITPLDPTVKEMSSAEKEAAIYALNRGLGKIFSKTIKSWSHIIRSFFISKVDWLCQLLPQLQFISAGADLLFRLKDKSLPLCRPEFSNKEDITEFYNPLDCLNDPIEKGDLHLDPNKSTYISAEPNQDSKSVFAGEVGILYAMLYLGLLLPAKSAKVKPLDHI